MTHKDQIRYDILAQEALRGVMRKVLTEVAKTGLPGNHHFFITFLTHAPGVRVSSRLRENYPEQMTIVLQYQYWDLTVSETGFEVGLSFSDVPEKLIVPFSAVRGFYDPSVNFELEFDVKSEESEAEDTDNAVTQLPAAEPKADKASKKPAAKPRRAAAKKTVKEEVAAAEPADGEPAKEEAGDSSAEVVSLDSFRKKK